MAWPDLVEAAHAAFLDTWGIPATLAPQSGSGPFSITGIIKNPGMEEQNVPGGAAGTGVLRFWVDFNSPVFLTVPKPQSGDTITVNGIAYTVGVPDVDIEGGATLKLRKVG
jgi:hypothetical protein